MNQFPTPKYTANKIAYYSFGSGNTTLLLVHGSFGNAKMWYLLIPQFIQAGFRVVALDLEGHGQSKNFDLKKSTMDSYASNIREVVQTIDGETVLIGHSMSGLLVLMVAVDTENIGKVIAIDPSPSKELQGTLPTTGIPDIYTPTQAGMPDDKQAMMLALPDIDPQQFAPLGKMLASESGNARRQRKIGISVPKSKLDPKQVLFLGAEYGDSLPFGISAASTKKMANYYQKPYFQINGATHPGIILGNFSDQVAQKIIGWLSKRHID